MSVNINSVTSRDPVPSRVRVRGQLDRERIVSALLELGVDRFSMHGVARHLGVSTTALYRYFPSRQALLDAVMDTFCEQLELPGVDVPWSEYLRELSRAFRKVLLSMPGAADYGTAVGPSTPAAFRIVERSLGVLRKAGFAPEAAWRAYGMVVTQAFQAVQAQDRLRALEARNGPGGFRIFQLTADEQRTYPEVAAVVDALTFDFDVAFEANLSCVIAGLESLLDAEVAS